MKEELFPMKNIREPAVAGYFYPAARPQLLRLLERFVPQGSEKEDAVAMMVPHAGYVYSGATAGATFAKVVVPETVVILGPNHTGYGEPYAVADHDAWHTPLGDVPLDREFCRLLTAKSRYLEEDGVAHIREHSIEVQLPFLQFLRNHCSIVPIALSGYAENPAWKEIGDALAETIRETGKETLIVASTDMTHYEPKEDVEEKDHYALEAVEKMDEHILVERLLERDISMCGYAPVIVAMVAAKSRFARMGTLVSYSTSGDLSGKDKPVVGYAGMIFQ